MRYDHELRRRTAGLALLLAVALGAAAQAQAPVPVDMHPELTREAVDNAITVLDDLAANEIADGTVPGLAIAVVFGEEVIFAKGYGVREASAEAAVDADTVFQLASVSKPVGATVVAALIGEGRIDWDTRIAELDPAFAMHAPWVTDQITIRDLYAHRSGLPDHAGDLLEDLGFPREEVLRRLRYLEPSSSFRSGYAYTNFGLTEAAVAAASAYGLAWEDASAQYLYEPLGMTSTSSRYADFEARENKAVGHVMEDGQWVHREQRQPDGESPAGGASSSVNDMAKWMRLQLGKGMFEGEQVVAQAPLEESHLPHMLTEARSPFGYPGFYGLGWVVGWTPDGRTRLLHSGAFSMGAATTVSLYPDDGLGVVVLSNAAPIGVPEALAAIFSDTAFYGEPTQDWMPLFRGLFQQMMAAEAGPDYSTPPDDPRPSADRTGYLGSYENDYFGVVEIVQQGDGLAMVIGPEPKTFPLTHYDGDTFTWETIGENAIGLSSVTFTLDQDRKAAGMFVGQLETHGDGRFARR
jgi:CubicO group peptidase (beta-lactamase class C family)